MCRSIVSLDQSVHSVDPGPFYPHAELEEAAADSSSNLRVPKEKGSFSIESDKKEEKLISFFYQATQSNRPPSLPLRVGWFPHLDSAAITKKSLLFHL